MFDFIDLLRPAGRGYARQLGRRGFAAGRTTDPYALCGPSPRSLASGELPSVVSSMTGRPRFVGLQFFRAEE